MFVRLRDEGFKTSGFDGGIRVFEAVTGERGGNNGAAGNQAGLNALDNAGERGGRGGLGKNTVAASDELVGGEDFIVGDLINMAVRLLQGGCSAGPARGIADANGGGNGLRMLDGMAIN